MYTIKGHDGTIYNASLMTGERKRKIEYAFYKLDVESVTALKDVLPEDDYRKQMAEKTTAFHRGDYKLTGPFVKSVLGTEACTLIFISVLFGMSEDDAVNMLMNVDSEEAIRLIELIMRKSFPQITDAQWEAAKNAPKN